MKPYEKYKESRIPWVDELPVAWEEFRLRYLGALDAGGVDKKINEGESLYKSVHYMDVYRGSLRNIFDSPNYLIVSATPQKRDKCILRKGDVLFTTSSETPNDIGHSCVIGEDLNDTLFGYHLLLLRVTDKIDFQFRKYLFGANYLRTWFSYRAVGMTRYGISNIDFADARIMIPPIDEQKKISNYLDQKVSQIDDLIQNKQELIDLLKEQRISVICSAVTKGIDSNGLDENEQEEFKSTLAKFVRTYTFLTNIIRLDDADLHKFHAYAKFLQKKLPKREGGGPIFLDDEVSLQYYRVQKIFEGSIALEQSEPLPNKLHPGKPKPEEEKAPLSELINKINEKFGTEFTNIDKVLEQIVSDMDANEELRVQARNNSQEHFRFPFNDAFMDVVIGRMAQNQQFCERVLDDAKFGDTVRDLLVGVVYERLRQQPSV